VFEQENKRSHFRAVQQVPSYFRQLCSDYTRFSCHRTPFRIRIQDNCPLQGRRSCTFVNCSCRRPFGQWAGGSSNGTCCAFNISSLAPANGQQQKALGSKERRPLGQKSARPAKMSTWGEERAQTKALLHTYSKDWGGQVGCAAKGWSITKELKIKKRQAIKMAYNRANKGGKSWMGGDTWRRGAGIKER